MIKNYIYYLLSIISIGIIASCKESEFNSEYVPALKEYYLSVTSTSYSVKSTNTSSRIDIKAGGNQWEISGGAPWLELGSKSGTGPSTVNFRTTTNYSSDTTKVCILNVNSEEGQWHRSIPITISQQKATPYITLGDFDKTISGKASSMRISIYSNTVWNASCDVNWAKVTVAKDRSYIDIEFSENTGLSRTATITLKGSTSKRITIVQQAANISASLQSLSFGLTGGTRAVEVSGEASWTARTSASWIDVNPSSGKAGTSNINITATANNSINDRTDFVYVCIGDNYKEIRVDQPGMYLNISNANLSFTATGGSKSISISSNTEWEVTSCPSWITLNIKSGTGNANLTISTNNNESVYARNGIIKIENKARNISRTISVTQNGHTFDTDTQELTFSDKAGSQSIDIQTDMAWSASTNVDWITLNTKSGIGRSRLSISVTENIDTSDRIGYVKVIAGGKTITIAVCQDSKYINISSDAFHFGANTGNAVINISTNYTWTARVESGVNWLIAMPKSGTGNSDITIGVSENNTSNTRTAKLYIETQGGKTYVINVTQDGHYLYADHSEINFSKNGGTETINVSTDGQFTVSKTGTWFGYTIQDKTITVLAGENNTDEDRTGKIVLTMTGVSSGSYVLEISVWQSRYSY